MKRLLYIFVLLVAFAAVSCVGEDYPQLDTEEVPEGYMKIEFAANIADPTMVMTRAVDPDGLDVNNMTLFCFNEFGLFISTETAQIQQHFVPEGIADSGIYTAQIPSHTRIIHFLGNHSEGLFDESNFPGQTESMVIANMEGGSGMLVYWSRFEMADNGKSMHDQLAELKYKIGNTTYDGIKLIRNQAKVSIEDWTTSDFTVTGFRTVNIPAFGTVAPHHPQEHFHIVDNWESTEDFVTLPNNQSLMSDIVDINTKNEDYIFETENSGDRQVSVIIRGHNAGETADKYYRIVMQHDDGSNFMIRRNHNYNIQITGKLTYPSNTFEEALVAPATNNAWISIDEWVNEIADGNKTLWVDKTSYVLASDQYAGTDFVIKYKYTEGGRGADTAPSVTWIDNNVAYDNIINNYNTNSGDGTLTLRLYPMYEGNEQQVGSFLIKKGKLQRKITVYVIKTQHFTPSWISTQVYGVSKEHVTLMFTIPETCPEALFPFTVLVSVNHLDVRSESGQQLPVYVKGEEGYFGQDWDGINYKYALTVSEPGKHRLFMHTLLEHKDTDIEPVHLEAEFFETITKNVLFSAKENPHYRVFVDDLHEYDASYAADEKLYYLLVPQKKASPLLFTLDLQQRQTNGNYVAFNHAADPGKSKYDEFLIYTKTLSFYEDYFGPDSDIYDEISSLAWEGEAAMVNKDSWSTNGRVMAFRTLGSKVDGVGQYGLQTDGSYRLYMLTNSTYNKDVVRVASNNTHSTYVFEKGPDGQTYGNSIYAGNEYRSVIFDVAHYRPFRFAAQVQVADENGNNPKITPEATALLSNEVHGDREEDKDNVFLSYKPGQQVDILLDITSFKGSDNRSVHPFGELFGEEFEVYIDAPMLEIDADRMPANWKAANNSTLTADKLRPDPSKQGRFIYTVSKKRADEREFGFDEAYNKDESTNVYDNFGGVVSNSDLLQHQIQNGGNLITDNGKLNQTGERKRLPFKKNSITSKGDITITSNKEKVVFWDKTFKVSTEHMKGVLKYKKKDGTVLVVPDDAFVAFVRMRTNARIGVVTLNPSTGGPGAFELNLRDEYRFEWKDDPIDFYYKDKTDGTVYNFNYIENGVKKAVDLNLLYTLLQNGTEIVLTEQVDDSAEG